MYCLKEAQHPQTVMSYYCSQEQLVKPKDSPHIKSPIFHHWNARQLKLLCRQVLWNLEQWETSEGNTPKLWRHPPIDCHLDWTSRKNPYTSIRMPKITNSDVPKNWQGGEEIGWLLHLWSDHKWYSHSGKQFPIKLNIHISYSPTPECLYKRNENLC